MDYGVGAGGGRCGSAALQWESIRKRGWASAETTQILPVRGAAVQLFAGDRGELPLPVRHLPADAGTCANDELYAIQAASTEPLEEADPTGLVLFHTLGST